MNHDNNKKHQFSDLDYYLADRGERFFCRYEGGEFIRTAADDPQAITFAITWYASEHNYDFEDIWTYTQRPTPGQLYVDRRSGRIVSTKSDDLPEGEFYIGGYEFEYAPLYNDGDGDFIYSRAGWDWQKRAEYRAISNGDGDDIAHLSPLPCYAADRVNDDLQEIALTTDCPEEWVIEWAGEIAAKLEEILGQFEETHEGQCPILVDDLPTVHRRHNAYEYFQSESSRMTHEGDNEREFASYLAQDYERAEKVNSGQVWPVFARIEIMDDHDKVLAETITYNVYDDERDYQAETIGEFIHELADYANELLAAREEAFGALA